MGDRQILEFDTANRLHPLIQLLGPLQGERILDLGCGSGELGRKILDQGAHVVGLDRDKEALTKASQLGLETILLDAKQIEFDQEFDAIFTNAMLNWLKPVKFVVPKLHEALKPGGRMVGEFGGHGNISSIRVALRHAFKMVGLNFDDYDPWDHLLTNDFCNMLQAAGFEIDHVETFPRYTPLPLGLEDWLVENLSDVFERLPDPETATAVKRETVAILNGITSIDQGHWIADFVRIRFKVTKLGSN